MPLYLITVFMRVENCALPWALKEAQMSTYTIRDHAHRFAVWAAGRAYSRSGGDGGGYSVQYAQRMLEAAGM